ncbi:glycosyltransferase family 39 protein [Pseudomonas cichorii]|nr:glycosyltransferase family 39 protein [Pseudomonas cichorii]MBX8554572.1 glycosyltransferase family 39 protein [Pseudomonas cichorii]
MSPDKNQRASSLLPIIPLLLVCAAIAASFVASSGPIQWRDNGMLLVDASQGQYFSQSLGPVEHPLYRFVTTLFFQLFGPQTLSLLNSMLLLPLAWIIYRLATSAGATSRQAMLAAVVSVLSHAVFWVSTKADVYVLHTLLMLMAYWVQFSAGPRLGDSRKLLVIGLLTGLGAATHQLTFVVLLPLYIQLLYRHRLRILMTLPGFIAGIAVAMPAIVHDLQVPMSMLETGRRYFTGSSAIVGDINREGSLLRFDIMWYEKKSVGLLLLSLLGPQLLGLLVFPRGKRLRLLWSAGLLNLVFAASYNVTDRFVFFLPGVALFSILGVIQLQAILARCRMRTALLNLSTLTSPIVILFVYFLYSSGLIRLPTHIEALPFRDDIHYFMAPYLPDRSAERFVRVYEASVPEGALLIADPEPMGAMRSAQSFGLLRGRKLAICSEAAQIHSYLDARGAYLTRLSYCAMIAEQYRLESWTPGYALHMK